MTGHLIIGYSEADVQKIFELVLHPDFDVNAYNGLEIHLNASKFDAWTEDRLAIILNRFHPLNAGAKSPHSLQWVVIVSHGGILFTRHDYTLISPTVSYDITNDLHKLMTNELSAVEKRGLPYKVLSTEKAFAKAILGIRDIPAVRFESVGNGIIEHNFMKEIEHTLRLPSGRPVPPVPGLKTTDNHGGKSLYDSASFESQGYKANLTNPYPIRSFAGISKKKLLPRKNAKLVDSFTMLLGEVEGSGDKSVIKEAVLEAKKAPRKVMAWNSARGNLQIGRAAPPVRTTRGRKKKAAVLGSQGGRDMVQSQNGRVLQEMVRIMSQNQDGEDVGMKKNKIAVYSFDQQSQGVKIKDGEWLVLTGKGARTKLAWKVTK